MRPKKSCVVSRGPRTPGLGLYPAGSPIRVPSAAPAGFPAPDTCLVLLTYLPNASLAKATAATLADLRALDATLALLTSRLATVEEYVSAFASHVVIIPGTVSGSYLYTHTSRADPGGTELQHAVIFNTGVPRYSPIHQLRPKKLALQPSHHGTFFTEGW